ncbi:MAG TPA: hypothetical protein P5556_04465 [Candidatus Gastranaerophilales bacterium]|nr:hypothetical protein [Candidatus Gastranaerophilales bacterium]
MIKESIKEQNPVKCVLTRIIDDFNSLDINKNYNATILKNYVYIPEKKIIA